MDIKALKSILIGNQPEPSTIGDIVKDVDDVEAKALIAVGYAEEVSEEEETKAQGNAPKNKSK